MVDETGTLMDPPGEGDLDTIGTYHCRCPAGKDRRSQHDLADLRPLGGLRLLGL